MRYLLDTGILLRLANREDVLHQPVRQALRQLKVGGHTFVMGAQNAAEFWNVCTRPATARGGLGLSGEQTFWRLRIVERFVSVLIEGPQTYGLWRGLVVYHKIQGVQVHDARLVALMQTHSITHIFTLNPTDFRRYPGITAQDPAAIIPAA